MRFTIFQESRKGSRKVNQDRIAYTYSRDTLLLVVADGMGGHAGGEIAAQIAVRLFIERFQQEAKPILKNPLKFLQETMLRAHAALGSYAEPVLDARDAAHDVRRLHRAGGPRLLGARRRFAALPVPAGRPDRRDQGSLEGAVPGRPGDHRRRRSRRASGSQQDLQLPGRPGRSGDRPVAAHAAAQRRHHRACAPTACGAVLDAEGDGDVAHVDADPQDRAADDARRREARRRRRRQPVGDRRALGPGDADRRAVDDDHRDARPGRIRDRRSTAR